MPYNGTERGRSRTEGQCAAHICRSVLRLRLRRMDAHEPPLWKRPMKKAIDSVSGLVDQVVVQHPDRPLPAGGLPTTLDEFYANKTRANSREVTFGDGWGGQNVWALNWIADTGELALMSSALGDSTGLMGTDLPSFVTMEVINGFVEHATRPPGVLILDVEKNEDLVTETVGDWSEHRRDAAALSRLVARCHAHNAPCEWRSTSRTGRDSHRRNSGSVGRGWMDSADRGECSGWTARASWLPCSMAHPVIRQRPC